MDASAYLTRHGWTGGGLGYSQTGIKKPLLASQKHGFQNKGLGGKPLGGHSDQWWLGAFDAGLKNLGSEKEKQVAVPAILSGPRYFKAELYRNFRQGEGLTGTITERMVSEWNGKHKEKAETIRLEEKKAKKDKKSKKLKSKSKSTSPEETAIEEDESKQESESDEQRAERRKRKLERRARKEERRQRRLAKQGG